MRHFPVKAVLAASALAWLPGCGDDYPPTGAIPVIATQPPVTQPPVTQPPDLTTGTLGYSRRELPVGGRIALNGPVYRGYDEDWGPLTYAVRDPSVAQWHGLGPSWGTIEGRTPGVTELTVGGSRMQATIPVTVLDTTSVPSPVVVDDFLLVEIQEAEQFEYVPRIVLRDTSAAGGSAVIGVWFEMPGQGATEHCAMFRPIGPRSTQVFRDWYGFEWTLPGNPRLSGDRPVVAHLTLRIPGPYAKELSVAARIVSGAYPSDAGMTNDDAMSCGSG